MARQTKTSTNVNKRISEVELYTAVRNGDAAAFSHYYEITMPWLVPYIRRITKDLEEAHNITHDTFAKLWQQREQIDPAQSLDGFVSKIAANAALDFARKRQSHNKYYGEQIFTQTAEDHAADTGMLADEIELLIGYAIQNMPPQRRRVFEMSREKNMTYDEIAAELGLSRNTVRNHMALALESIRAVLAMTVLFFTSLMC